MAKFSDLYTFVDSAVKNRKYGESTAYGFKTALKLFEKELNDDELASLERVLANIEPLTRTVYSKNNNRFTVESINAYKGRVLKVAKDFQEYGSDPSKMASWNPLRRSVLKKKPVNGTIRARETDDQQDNTPAEQVTPMGMQRFDRELRPGVKAIVFIPSDMSADECAKIEATLRTYIAG